jgi:hypothetical protein
VGLDGPLMNFKSFMETQRSSTDDG